MDSTSSPSVSLGGSKLTFASFLSIYTDRSQQQYAGMVDAFMEGMTMSKGYWIARGDVADTLAYQRYVAANALPFKTYGARFLVRGGAFENPEGTSRTRNVVIEFPSYQDAVDCWHSAEYQAAIQLRLPPVAELDLVIVEGYDGVQP